jgi:hypothetical protein
VYVHTYNIFLYCGTDSPSVGFPMQFSFTLYTEHKTLALCKKATTLAAQIPLYISYILSQYIHFVVCLATGPYYLSNWVVCRLWPCASSFKLQHNLFPLRSSSSCLRLLLPRLPVPFPFSLFNTLIFSHNYLLHPSPTPHFKTLKVFLIYFPKCPRFKKICSKCNISLVPSVNLSQICLWKNSSSCWRPLMPWKSWL